MPPCGGAPYSSAREEEPEAVGGGLLRIHPDDLEKTLAPARRALVNPARSRRTEFDCRRARGRTARRVDTWLGFADRSSGRDRPAASENDVVHRRPGALSLRVVRVVGPPRTAGTSCDPKRTFGPLLFRTASSRRSPIFVGARHRAARLNVLTAAGAATNSSEIAGLRFEALRDEIRAEHVAEELRRRRRSASACRSPLPPNPVRSRNQARPFAPRLFDASAVSSSMILRDGCTRSLPPSTRSALHAVAAILRRPT